MPCVTQLIVVDDADSMVSVYTLLINIVHGALYLCVVTIIS